MSERDYMKLPPPLSYEGNIAENWREGHQLFELYSQIPLSRALLTHGNQL